MWGDGMSNGLTIKEFDHKLKGGNFYSKGLCAWLKKNPDENRIVKAVWNSFDGYNPQRPVLMIGKFLGNDFFCGNRLNSVCRERGARKAFVFTGDKFHIDEWVDVTDEFIDSYRKIGRCAIHGDVDHDFDENNSLRVCKRCGATFERKVELVEWFTWERVEK